MPWLCLFLPNDLCTRLENFGRPNTLADSDSEDTSDEDNIIIQGVASYMSLVEAFATGIKMKSIHQHPFWELIGDWHDLQMAKIKGSMTLKRHIYHFVFWTTVNQWSRASKGSNQVIKFKFCRWKILIPVTNASEGNISVTTPWYRTCARTYS